MFPWLNGCCRARRLRLETIAVGLGAALTAAAADPLPRVWIFNGTPGDNEHHEFYEKTLASVRRSFIENYGLPAERVRVFYGPVTAGYDGACTREVLLAELKSAVAHTQEPEASPVWLIFQGHANAIAGGALFNLPGPDVSAREIGEALHDASPTTPMVVFATTACSAAFLPPLAKPGRIVVSATTAKDPENETEYPAALAAALASPSSDTNADGLLSVTELFLACHAQVQNLYEAGNFMIKERAQLDGDGDGRGTQRPAPADADPASTVGLAMAGRVVERKKFD